MRSPLKLVRDYQKQILTVFGVGLMITFLIQLAPSGSSFRGTASPVVATLAGTKVAQAEIKLANAEWRELWMNEYIDPNDPQVRGERLAMVILGQSVASEINQNPTTFFLLVQDARRQGMIVPQEQVNSLLANNIHNAPQPGAEGYDVLQLSVHDGLLVEKLVYRVGDAVKMSQPLQNWALARSEQMLALKVVSFPAAKYLSATTMPTAAEIQQQYAQYSDRTAAQLDKTPSQYGQDKDPLGFGYKIPNRVQVQYIGLDRAEARRAAIASRSEVDWQMQAFEEFSKNRSTYDDRPVLAPTTRPAAQPPGATTRPATEPSDEPTVQKLADLDADYKLHAQLVLDDLYARETENLQENAEKFVSDKMNSAYSAYRDAQAAGGAATQASGVATFLSGKFMADLCQEIQSKFGIKAVNGDLAQFKTEQELSQIKGIGDARAPIPGTTSAVGFALYAVVLYQPWLPADLKDTAAGILALAQWQPSSDLQDSDQNVYIFRISGADPAHTPPLEDVKDQVIRDWKTAEAYKQAQAAADHFLEIAKPNGLDSAAAAEKLNVIDTDPFLPQTLLNPNGQTDVAIKPLKLAVDSVRELTAASLQLLNTAPGGNGRPQLTAQLYADRLVAVVELNQAMPLWTADDKSTALAQIITQYGQMENEPLYEQFCSYDAAAARMNYRPDPKFNADR